MQTVRRDAGPRKTTPEFAREQDIGECCQHC
jgi:hypothetical protein